MEHPWRYDEKLEKELQKNYPFRDLKAVELPRYGFRGEK